MGELLSMEVPVITNTGVGDVDSIIKDTHCGISISNFNISDYQKAVADLLENRNLYKKNTVMAANQYFSLKDGIEQYTKVYNSFNKK
jgi:glycosyltransferase involved in cell wall biosynthesis